MSREPVLTKKDYLNNYEIRNIVREKRRFAYEK